MRRPRFTKQRALRIAAVTVGIVALGAASVWGLVFDGREVVTVATGVTEDTIASTPDTLAEPPTTTTTSPPETTTTTEEPAPTPAPSRAPAPAPTPPPTEAAPPPPPPPPPAPAPGGLAGQIGALTGRAWNGQLAGVAASWASFLVGSGGFYHQNLQSLINGALAGFQTLGETMWAGPPSTGASDIYNSWVNSPPHYAILTNGAFTMVGVGCAVSGSTMVCVADFGG